MASEPWSVLGSIQEKPIWITGSAFGGAGGAVVVEEAFSAATSSNSLAEYQTAFPTGLESASVVKASAGQLYQVLMSNPSGIPVYLQLFNRTSSPPLSTAPVSSYRVEPSSSISLDFRAGKPFSTGIVLGMSTIYHAFSGTASGSFNAFYK